MLCSTSQWSSPVVVASSPHRSWRATSSCRLGASTSSSCQKQPALLAACTAVLRDYFAAAASVTIVQSQADPCTDRAVLPHARQGFLTIRHKVTIWSADNLFADKLPPRFSCLGTAELQTGGKTRGCTIPLRDGELGRCSSFPGAPLGAQVWGAAQVRRGTCGPRQLVISQLIPFPATLLPDIEYPHHLRKIEAIHATARYDNAAPFLSWTEGHNWIHHSQLPPGIQKFKVHFTSRQRSAVKFGVC